MSIINSISDQKLTSTSTPSFNNVTNRLTSIATTGGTTTLTASSTNGQLFTGTLTETLVLPVVSTLSLGQSYKIINKSTGAVTVQSSGGNTVQVMEQDTTLLVICISLSGTTAASWQAFYNPTAPFTFPLTPSLGGTGISNSDVDTLTITGASTINQDVSTSGTPTFGNIKIDTNSISSLNVGGNITLIPDGTGNVDIFTPPASESSSITVNGFPFNAAFRINDIGTVAPAQSIIHRHSTTLEPVLLYARSNSDTDAHAAVTNGMALSSTYTSGWTGAQYSLFGQIRISADATGTISDTSAPGKLDLMVSPNGSITPVTALSINNAGLVSIGNLGFTGNTISSTNTNGWVFINPNGTGRLQVGDTTVQPSVDNNNLPIKSISTTGNSGIGSYCLVNNAANVATYDGYRSRSGSPSSNVAIQNGDTIASFQGLGDDGSAFRLAANMSIRASGTVSSGIVPGEIRLRTTNTSGTLTTALTISNAQVVTLANPLPVASGGTGLASYTANNLIYASGTSTLAGLATANNGLLVTNGSGVPSIGNSIGASISVTGAVTATTGVNTGVSGTSSATNTINTSNASATAYTITKSSASNTAVTFLQITIPAGLYFVGVECFIINSRAPSSGVGTSFVEKRYFSIARNGSGSDVVLDSAAGADFTSTTTTAGGSQNAISGVTTIARNGAESNTSPQVVNLTINPQTTAGSTGFYVAQCNILMLGSQTGFSIS